MRLFTKSINALLAAMLVSVWVFGQSGKADVQKMQQIDEQSQERVSGARDVLYDNGPFVTHPGAGSNGSDYSVVQVDLGLGAIGESVDYNGPTLISMADDFVVTDTWTITSFTFYAYQTGTEPPSNMNLVKVAIWDGNPMEDPTAAVIWGEVSTTGPDLFLSSDWTNCWRVKTPYTEARPIMNIVANTTGLILQPGTYWVQYSIGSSTSETVWANMISIIGQAETGNSIQKQGNSWGTNADNGFGQGLPFIINGTTGSLPENDLALIAIPSPNTGMQLGVEPVSVKVYNMGTGAQSGFDVSYSINGGDAVTETISASVASFETYEYTFNTPADLSGVGTYDIQACVHLTGDENTENDCKSKEVVNIPLGYCDASTISEDEFISRVVFGSIDNTSVWQSGIADYTDIYTSMGAGNTEDITITNGTPYSKDAVSVWVDWNDDFVFEVGGDEEFVLTNSGTGALFTGSVTVPAEATDGLHRMRVRLVYDEVPEPCGSSSYGEIEEYSILVADPTYGDLEGTVTAADGGAAIEGATVMVDEYTTTTAADGTYSFLNLITGTKTITCVADGYYETSETVVIEDGITSTIDFELSGVLYGMLEGTVTDGSAAIEGATVTVGGITGTSGSDGMYSFMNVEIGTYDVTCVATGYSFEYETDVLIEEGITTIENFELTETGIIPANFSATVVDVTDVLLEWEPPAGALMEISQHDGAAQYVSTEFFDNGYGVVFDLSSYPGATLEMMDFYHVASGLTGVWDYKVHIVDWETHTELMELGPFQTSVNDDWEQDVYLGSYPAGISGVIGVIIEPLGNIATDAYPRLALDESRNGNPVRGPLSDYSAFGQAGGDYLLDLWIISPNGKKMVQPNKVCASNLNSDAERKNYTPIEGNSITNKKSESGSKGFIGYNAYRDGVLIAENLFTTHYTDLDLPTGSYSYDVKAVYDEGLSDGAGPIDVFVGEGVARDKVIIEVATGTWCTFCPGAAMGVDEMYEEGLSVGVVEYHSDDAFTTTEVGFRISYYGSTGFPTAFFDGLDPHSGGSSTNSLYGSYLPKYENRIAVPALFELETTYQNVSGNNYQILVDAEMIEEYQGVSNDIVLQVALTESHIEYSWQNQTELNFVCRDMIPTQEGTILDFEGSATQSVQLDFTIPDSYEMENIELVVFLQDNSTHEILQGSIAELSTGMENIAANNEIKIFPNPATDNINITANSDILVVTVYNNMGQVVFDEKMERSHYKLNANNYNKGLYFIQLKTEKGIVSKRVVIE